MLPKLELENYYRFGAEMEINAFDNLNRPLGYLNGELPAGIHYVGNLVQKTTHGKVTIHKWGNDHHNESWVVKPDGSCGMEVCSPVMKGWTGLMEICRVAEAFKYDAKIKADNRCSFHVHVDVSDLTERQLATILTWWIKCEPVFMDSVPALRKKNQYCQFIGLTDLFNVKSGLLSSASLISRLGQCKYYTINTFHYHNRRRKTIEFRIMDGECCKDPWMTKNWIRLLLHFIQRSLAIGMPLNYEGNDAWSGYCWLDPFDVFKFLGFSLYQYELSPALSQVRSWFVERLMQNSKNSNFQGVFGDFARQISISQIENLNLTIPKENIDVYSSKFRI